MLTDHVDPAFLCFYSPHLFSSIQPTFNISLEIIYRSSRSLSVSKTFNLILEHNSSCQSLDVSIRFVRSSLDTNIALSMACNRQCNVCFNSYFIYYLQTIIAINYSPNQSRQAYTIIMVSFPFKGNIDQAGLA